MLLVFIFMVVGRDAPDFKTVNNRVMVKITVFHKNIQFRLEKYKNIC